LENKLCNLEKKLEENISGKVLTENRFLQEIQSTDELVDKIVSKFNSLSNTPALSNTSAVQEISGKINDGSFGRGEAEKVGLIADLLQTNKRLSSIQLAKLINISRTRANEYLRMMEKLGIVKGFLIGKEKYYQLKHSFVSPQ
jgi:predicted transcriptional regulator